MQKHSKIGHVPPSAHEVLCRKGGNAVQAEIVIANLSANSSVPSDIWPALLWLFLGAAALAFGAVVVVRKRKKLPAEVWIPLLAVCVIGSIALLFVGVCTAAVFVIAR